MVPGVFAAVLLLLAGLILAIGWFGPALPIAPECAACRFCLDGLGTRDTCPECGANILAPRGRRVRVRRRRPKFLLAGSVLLVLGLGLAESIRRNFNWFNVLPLSVLEASASRGDPFDPSLDELLRRGFAGQAPPELLGRVVRSLLATNQSERARTTRCTSIPSSTPPIACS